MRLLITGGTGLLGKSLLESVPSGITVAATYFQRSPPGQPTCEFYPMDVQDQKTVQSVFAEVKPEVVIHAASIGDVDYAEHSRREAWLLNVGGTQNIVEECRRSGAKVIFISTNAVFDGDHPPYSEEDPTHPINYYGQLKVEGEQVTTQSGIAYAIVRPILMYGWPNIGGRGNLATWVVENLEQRKAIKVVNDVYSKPLLAQNCAAACWAVVEKDRTGTYHVAGRDRVSLYDFAQEVAKVFGLDERLITAVPSSYFPEIAPRPRDTSYNTRKMKEDLGIRPMGLREGLTYLKDHRPQA